MRYQFHPGNFSNQAIGFPEHYNTNIQFLLFILEAAGYSHFTKQNFNDFLSLNRNTFPLLKFLKY